MFGIKNKDEDDWGTSFSKGEDSWGTSNMSNSSNTFYDEEPTNKKAKIIAIIIAIAVISAVVYFSIYGLTKKNKLSVEREKQEQLLEKAKQELKVNQDLDISKITRELDPDYAKKLEEYKKENSKNEEITNKFYNSMIERYNEVYGTNIKEFQAEPTVIYLGKEPIPMISVGDSNTMVSYKGNELKAVIVNKTINESSPEQLKKDLNIITDNKISVLSDSFTKKTTGNYIVYTKEGVEYLDFQN